MSLFKAIFLPSVASQPANRFIRVALTSDNLPEHLAPRLKKQLVAVSRHLPGIPVADAGAGDVLLRHRESPLFRSRRGRYPNAFRFDDDDAAAADFVECIKRYRMPNASGSAYRSPKGWVSAE